MNPHPQSSQPTNGRDRRGDPHEGGWTEERIGKLIDLWKDGFTATQIAAELGGSVTRSAVCGKVNRLKLPPRTVTVRKVYSRPDGTRARRKPEERMAPPRAPTLDAEPVEPSREPVAPLLIGLHQLTERTCKYPVGDPRKSDFGFCGHPSREGSPYCPEHHRRCYAGFGNV